MSTLGIYIPLSSRQREKGILSIVGGVVGWSVHAEGPACEGGVEGGWRVAAQEAGGILALADPNAVVGVE